MELIYTRKDRMLFWIAEYRSESNSSNVMEKVKYLSENAEKFAKETKCNISDVKTFVVEDYCKYKNKRIFYVEIQEAQHGESQEEIEKERVPASATIVKYMTMNLYLY